VALDTTYAYYPVLAVSGDTAFIYAAKDTTVYLLSVLLPSGTILDSLPVGPYFGVAGLRATLRGNLLYIADREAVRVFDVSDPYNLQLVAYRKTPDNAVDLSVSGAYVFVSITSIESCP